MASSSGNDITVRINAVTDPSFRRTINSTVQQIHELEQVIQSLSGSEGLNDLRRDAQQAENSVDSLEGKTKSLGDALKGLAESGQKALMDMAKGQMKKVVEAVGDQQEAMAQLQASTGMTADQMKQMNAIAEDLYKQNYGSGFEDLGQVMATVKQFTGQTGDELEQTAKAALTFRDVFKEEIPQSLKASDMLMKKFGITSEQAYNLLAQGAQSGLNNSGDLMEVANQYAVYFKEMGYSANEMFDALAAGTANGSASLDNTANSVKEFSTRIKKGTSETKEAIYALFAPQDLDKFVKSMVEGGTKSAQYLELVKIEGKQTANILLNDFSKGGVTATKAMDTLRKSLGDGDRIFKGMADGSITGKEAINEVIQKLKEVKDPVSRNQLALELFGTEFQDMETNAALALGNTRKQFDMTKQTMQGISDIKDDTVTQKLQGLGREMMSDLVIPITEDLMPALSGVTNWMSNNKNIVETTALIAPAGLVAKNAWNIVKSVGTVGAAAEGAAGAAGGLGAAFGMLVNPFTAAVGVIGAAAIGYQAFKNHQEKARQELLHMGEGLDESAEKFQNTQDKAKVTNDLIWQYNALSKKIAETSSSTGVMADKTEKLKDQQGKLRDVTSKLQQLHPETIRQYDVENGKIQSKLGLVKLETDAERELAKASLEKSVLEGKAKLPDLEKQMEKSKKRVDDLRKQNDTLDPAIAKLTAYEAEYEKIMMEPPSTDRDRKLEGLRSNVNSAASEAGYNKGRRNFNTVSQLSQLDNAVDFLTQERLDNATELEQNTKDFVTASNSYETLYDKAKSLIELNMGGTFEEQAKNYGKMTDQQKANFMSALEQIKNLNDQMDLLPTEKKINVKVITDQIGLTVTPSVVRLKPSQQEPKAKVQDYLYINQNKSSSSTSGATNTSTSTERTTQTKGGIDFSRSVTDSRKASSKTIEDSLLFHYADGGIATRPSIFGEAGPEIAIPLNNKPRSYALLDMANQLMGRGNEQIANSFTSQQGRFNPLLDAAGGLGQYGGDEVSVVFAPKIIIQGGGADAGAQVSKALNDQQPVFERQFMAMLERRERVSMRG